MGYWDKASMAATGGTVDASKGMGTKKTVNPFGAEGGSAGSWDVLGNALDSRNPFVQGQKDNKDKADQVKASQEAQYGDTEKSLSGMKSSDQSYYDKMSNAYTGAGGYQSTMNANANQYMGDINKYKNQVSDQAKDSKAVYSNDILPNLKGVMEDAGKNAAGAMTLQQSMDPNNAVATNTRQFYNDQAAGANKEGLADAGVLSAMGSQATAGQFGASGGLMTGGQLQALQGANLGQSGAAMARAQGRANDLRQQGIDMGFKRSDNAYDQGQKAKGFYNDTIGNYENANANNTNMQNRFSGQQYAASGDMFGTQMGQANANLGITSGLAGLQHGQEMQQSNRELGALNDKYGTQQGNLINSINAENSKQQAFAGMGGTIIGGMMGGAAGAKGGQAAGTAAGGSGATAAPSQYGQYGGHNPYGDQNPNGGTSPSSPYYSQDPNQQKVA